MKLYVVANGQTQQIESISLTSNTVDDATEVESLMSRINKPVKRLIGYGAYDKTK